MTDEMLRWKFQRDRAKTKGTAPVRARSREIAYWSNGKPYNAHRQRLVEKPCDICKLPFLSTVTSHSRFCSTACCAKNAVATGRFAGEKNPRWLGGVSQDNMRYRTRQMERWPEKEATRKKTANAIACGKLIRLPCEKCGEPKSEAHHDDYSKPLSVRWLCRLHHVEHHQQEKRRSRITRIEAKRP